MKKLNKLIQKNIGVDHPVKNAQIKEKIKQTCLKKYNKTSYSKTRNFKEKIKQTCLEKYKCTNHEFLDKWNHMNQMQCATPLFSLADVENKKSKKRYPFKCSYCGKTFFSMWKNGGLTNHCQCLKQHSSICERELCNFCKQYFPKLFPDTFEIINPYELDIYIPEISIAIEFNGIYWHNQNKKSKNYHLKKTKLCQQKNIRLIHIWQDDWQFNKDKIKEKLIKIFNNELIIENNNKQLILDRCWFPYKKIINIYNKTFILEKVTQPQLCKNNCYDCGKLIYKQL